MADALISPTVAAVAGVVSTGLIITAARKAGKNPREGIVSTMGVLGAFVFAAQMINFTIPGTGSSGHIIGGVLLSAMLGPWCGFLTLCSVLIVQCLIFADGGLMALGCNIFNMAAMSCLVAYPLVYKPLVRYPASATRLIAVSVATSVIALELGALAVCIETKCSGITALPFSKFCGIMCLIHLAIGAIEGVATGAVLAFVQKNSPDMLVNKACVHTDADKKRRKWIMAAFAIAAVVMAALFAWIASENPDGLEWSIERITGSPELAPAVVPGTALMPDYSSHFSGIIGALIVMAIVWSIALLAFRQKPCRQR